MVAGGLEFALVFLQTTAGNQLLECRLRSLRRGRVMHSCHAAAVKLSHRH